MRMGLWCGLGLCLVGLQMVGGAQVVATASAAPAAGQRTLVRVGKLLDVKTGKEPVGQTIVVVGERIVGIAATASTPAAAGDKEIDLTRYTVMPGMMDVHTHITMATNFDPYWELSMTLAKEGIIGVENAKVTLEAGFTSIRNVGAGNYADVALRDEVNAGHVPGRICRCQGRR